MLNWKKAVVQPVPAQSTLPCPICVEPIPLKAKLCKHCKSDLSWRRHISISNTTLALLTALIAVLGALGPTVKRLWLKDDSEISAVYVGRSNDQVAFLLSNSGSKAGSVKSGQFYMFWTVVEPPPGNGAEHDRAERIWRLMTEGNGDAIFRFTKLFYPSGGAAFLKSGHTEQRLFVTDPQAASELDPSHIHPRSLIQAMQMAGEALFRGAHCGMKVHARHASGKSEVLDIPVDCIDFDKYVMAAFDDRARIAREVELDAMARTREIDRQADGMRRERLMEMQQQQEAEKLRNKTRPNVVAKTASGVKPRP
jgi:hypothetical protein